VLAEEMIEKPGQRGFGQGRKRAAGLFAGGQNKRLSRLLPLPLAGED
jgi:hypothetical protein